MRLRIWIYALFCFFYAHTRAVDQDFNGGAVSSTTGVTSQPASLAFIRREKQFSASVTSFEKTDYNFQGINSVEEDSPFVMKPLAVGSAFSTRYGGWSLLILNVPFQYRTEILTDLGGSQSVSDFKLNGNVLAGQLSTGWKIGDHWGLGGALILAQSQSLSTSISHLPTASVELFAISESQQETQEIRAVMGSLLVYDEFVFGMKWTSPQMILNSEGRSRTRVTQTPLPTGAPTFTDTKTKEDPETEYTHDFEVGVRFGRNGFSYLISNDWQSSGLHTTQLAFEYVGSWGTITSGLSLADLEKTEQKALTVGFIKDHGNFKWGVGPYYREVKGEGNGDLSTKSFGVLYSSEIRY